MMLDSRGRRVAINVGLAVVLISVGSVLLLRTETSANRASARVLLDTVVPQQAAVGAIKTCDTRNQGGAELQGICYHLVPPETNGCCGQNDPPTLPDFSGCSSQCITRAVAFWCTVSCTNKGTSFCPTDVEWLLGNCSSCPVFQQNGLTPIQWASTYEVTTSQSACVEPNARFLAQTPAVETAPPTITINTITQDGTVKTVIGGVLTVTSVLAPLTSVVQLSRANLVLASITYPSSSWIKSPNTAPQAWQLTYSFDFSSQTSAVTTSQTLDFYASVSNTYGTTTTTVTQSNAQVRTTVTVTDWGQDDKVDLKCTKKPEGNDVCPGSVYQVQASETPIPFATITADAQAPSTLIQGSGSSTTAITVDAVSLQATPGCNGFSGLSAIVKSITTADRTKICLNDTLLSLEGGASTLNAGTVIVSSGNSRINIKNGAALTLQGTTTASSLSAPVTNAGTLTVPAGNTLSVVSPITLATITTGSTTGSTITLGDNAVVNCFTPTSSATCLEMAGGAVAGEAGSTVNVNQGTIIQTSAATASLVVAKLNIGPTPTTAGSEKALPLDTTTAGVSGSVVVGKASSCPGFNFGSGELSTAITVNPRGALFVSGSCAVSAGDITPTGAPTLKTAAKVIGSLTVENGGKVVFTDVTQPGNILVVTGDVLFKGSNGIEVQFSQTNVPSTPYDVYLMQWPAAATDTTCEVGTTVTVTNPSPNRPPVQSCKVIQGFKYLVLSVTNVTNVTPPSPVVPTKFSVQYYTITLGKECNTFSQSDFLNAIAANTGLPTSFVIVDSYTCGSITAKFHCGDTTSQQQADANCQSILNSANSGALKSIFNTQATNTGSRVTGDASNSGLWALFVLVLVPIFCIFCIILIVRNKNRKADNQYKQDTATFANVASSPQPMSYPYPYPGATQTQPQPSFGYTDAAKAYELPPAGFAPVPQVQAPYPY